MVRAGVRSSPPYVLMRTDTRTRHRCPPARACLLQSIHGVDEVTPEIEGYTITHHIEVATPKSHVVPIAMLLATGRFTRQSAAKALAAEPVLRNIVKQLQTAAA